ncbi:flagellar basal-body MS-ring/collar protein FliF [Clostridium cylindrosporum]|uniref:Flagellar M-ring protein n=1 Tax=Clostridium cylindrosporum DSM 605 TaxID=1121307 RepID=A0A0J8DBK9_CLOCY|nr:flagellar basal-body MS-ring/collar protein FliF [Clostridium cylindrosporum]KMT21699.1 flagellar M-ring protein FliF [Clostridium cylindrosporum DSM 605]
MSKFLEFFKDKFEKWKAWSKIKKIISISLVALLISTIVIGIVYGAKTEYATLFSNLELADSNKVVEKLKADKIPYKIEGNSILVPKENVDELRMSTLSDGTVSSGKGFELFDQTAFGMTDKEATVKYQRALQGELEKTISGFEEVEKARVLLVLPEETVFSKETEKGRASVTLALKGVDTLQPEKVKAIVALITGSVKNVPKENVEVMDSKMNLLTENLYDSGTEGTVSSLKQHDAEISFEKKLQSEVTRSLEAMFGKNKVRVNVNADLDFDSKQRTTIVYDKDDVIPRSVKDVKESTTDSSGNTVGTPGVDTNAGVNYPQGNSTQGESNSEKSDVTTNNEIGQTEEKLISAPGEVRRLTSSVMIDGNLTEAEKASVRNMVAAAIGFDSVNRRDVINVDSMIFDEASKKAEKLEAEKIAKQEAQQALVKTIVLIAVGVVLLVGSIVALLIWRKRKREEEELIQEAMEGTGTNLNIADSTSPMGPSEYSPLLDENEEDYGMNLESEIRSYASKKPEQVVEIIKTWLSEDER